MLLLDWLTAILRGSKPPTPSPSQPQTEYAVRRHFAPPVSTSAAAQRVAYPLRQPSVEPLPALISRCIGPLDRGQRPAKAGLKTWDSMQAELRQTFADHFARIEPYLTGELAHTHPDQVAQISAHSQQAAFLLSAGAWAVGHEDRLKVQTDAERLRVIAEASFGSIPIDSRKAIEPAISFAFWFFGSLLDGYYASSYGTAERDERDAQLRAVYRTFVQAALASYRAGLAFEDRRPEKVG